MQRSDWDPDWERIKEICRLALPLPPEERADFIANACQHDPALISEIGSLINASASPDADKLIGTMIGDRYVVERELDRGAMGRVYLALDRRLDDRPVVIKILLEASLRNADVVQRFKQEAVALSRITHPRVVGVLDAGELKDGTPYIVMQYVEGETLRRRIRPEGLELARAAEILKQIGEALEHVHEKEIFHRDLKPENILIESGTESVKIVDFGVAKVTDSAVGPGTVNQALIGTVIYMSPERLRGERSTAESDIYSMAVIAYEMITGRRPFKAKTPAELLKIQRGGVRVMPVDDRPDVSPKAQKILLRALSFRASARYRNAREFGDALAGALLEAPVRRRSKKWAGVVAVSIALLSIGIYIYFTWSPDVIPVHYIKYWLTVQRTRDGIDYQPPFQSFGEETFANGDKFRLNVSSREPGFLYVFNEGPPETNNISFKIVYPNPKINNGLATIGANQPVQSDWITFRGPAGAENFWIVWATSPVSELESAKIQAFKQIDGALTDQTLVRVKDFLRAQQSARAVKTTRYKANQTALVRGTSKMLITFVEVRHR